MTASPRSIPPRAPGTRLKAWFMGRVASAEAERRRQRRGRRRRRGEGPRIEYFHQLDDPFSFLAVQRLDALAAAWDVAIVPHLVPPPTGAWLGDVERQPRWALADARDVAPFFGVEPPGPVRPGAEACLAAAARLAQAPPSRFAQQALELGRGLWNGAVLPTPSPAERADAEGALARGAARRDRLGHYAGALFHFDGEGYGGLDRLPHLEERLAREGFARGGAGAPVVPTPTPEPLAGRDASQVTLEVFPSLRSPYTAVSFRRALDLADRTGVHLWLRPVMPMMMRGVPAPRRKQLHILSDAAREGRRHGVAIGRPVDPFGEPVRRALSLWSWVDEAGRGAEFLAAYLDAAWLEGLDVTRDEGLLEVVRRAGLDPAEAEPRIGTDASDAVLAENLEAMLGAGLWGVPSFRVSDGDAPPLACWGQDRLWRIETEIARRARALHGEEST
ncbi:MAG: DsbA family protein [Pseudomonadales bacterium]|jgi:2-hydroxychromene-2-carboxylate isomerase|nr:DsbA family protein [Pseudomonadales bacterium]